MQQLEAVYESDESYPAPPAVQKQPTKNSLQKALSLKAQPTKQYSFQQNKNSSPAKSRPELFLESQTSLQQEVEECPEMIHNS